MDHNGEMGENRRKHYTKLLQHPTEELRPNSKITIQDAIDCYPRHGNEIDRWENLTAEMKIAYLYIVDLGIFQHDMFDKDHPNLKAYCYEVWKQYSESYIRELKETENPEEDQLIFGYYLKSIKEPNTCLLYTSPSPRDRQKSRMPSSA